MQGRRGLYLVLLEEVFSRDADDLVKIQIAGHVGQGVEGKVGRFVHLEELVDGRLHLHLCADRGRPIAPEHLGHRPPFRDVALGLEDEGVAIPNAGALVAGTAVRVTLQPELLGGVVQDVVLLDEQGCAKLDGQIFVAVHVDGQSAAADVIGLLEDGDVDVDAIFLSKLLQVVRGRRASSAGAWGELAGQRQLAEVARSEGPQQPVGTPEV